MSCSSRSPAATLIRAYDGIRGPSLQ
jgi:hypothetical protein